MILGVEQASMKTDGTEDLFRGLLQMIRCQDIGRIGEKTRRCIEIELRSVQQPL